MTSIAPADPAEPRRDAGRRARPRRVAARLSFNLRQSGIYVAFALIVVLFSVLTDGALLQPQNISNIIVQNSYILILAIGMILIIIAGHIDLSAGSVVAVTGARLRRADGRTCTCRGRWRCSSTIAVGAADRRLPGLLDRLLRHPGVHRHPGRHARVPRAHADGAGQPGHRPVPRRRPHAVQRLHRRASSATSASARSAAPTCSRLLVGAGGGRRRSRSPQWRARARPARLRPGRRPVPGVRREDRRAPRWSSCSSSSQLARFKNLPWVLVLLAALVVGVLAAHQPRGVRPPHLRRRRQPAGRRAVRRQGQVGHVLDLREHGRAGGASPASSSPAGSTRPGPTAGTPSSSTPSPRRSSAAPRCRAASARSSARSPAA